MLTHISKPAERLQRNLGLTDSLSLLERAWDAEIGGLRKASRIIALDRSALVVEADSAPAMQEITLRRKELIRRLNQHFSEQFIHQIMVKLAHG